MLGAMADNGFSHRGSSRYDFRDPVRLGATVAGWQAFVLLLSGIAVVIEGVYLVILLRAAEGEGGTAGVPFFELARIILGVLTWIVVLVAGFLFLKWAYRTMANAHALATEPPSTSPPWAVAWFFIPIFNLWKPYLAIKSAWRRFLAQEGRASVPGLADLWWAANVLTFVVALASGILNSEATRQAGMAGPNAVPLEAAIPLAWAALVGSLLQVLVVGLTIPLVRSLSRDQNDFYEAFRAVAEEESRREEGLPPGSEAP